MKQNPDDFIVESTPVVDLKKSNSAGLSWDNEKTEVYLEDEGAGTAFLVGPDGDHVSISVFPFVIGRGNECDLVLNGKGISRKHAEIVFQSGRFVVNDLDSLNGLKVNGYKVARVILEEGDTIKLGEVSLVFTSSRNGATTSVESRGLSDAALGGAGERTGAAAVSGQSGNSAGIKKLVLSASIASFIAAIGYAGFQYFNGAQTAARVKVASVTPVSGTPAENVEADPAAAPAASANAQPAAAPDAGAVQASAATAAPEIRDEPAPIADNTAVGSAPPPSIAPVSPASGKFVPPPVAEAAPAPKSRPVAPPPARAQASAPIPAVVAPAPVVRAVEPPPVAAYVPPRAPSSTDVTSRYLKGDADSLLRELQETASNPSLSSVSRQSAKAKHEQISRVFGLYSTGKQQFAAGRTGEGLQSWSQFLTAEKSLTGGQKSVYTATVLTRIVDEYVAQGNKEAKAGNHHQAYKQWSKALEFGDSVSARIAIDGVNQKSKQLYRQALRLEYVNTERAKSLWREVVELVPPGTEYYTKASSKLAWYDKWGA